MTHKKLFIGVSILIILLAGGYLLLAQERSEIANIGVEITPETVDLGTVVYGDVAKTAFTLTNNTNNPLTITRVSTSCACTKVQVEKEKLEAYKSIAINVSFDPAVHKDDYDLGDITRTIYIETDNINFSKLEVNITATVVKKG